MNPVYEIKFLSNSDFDSLPVTETNGSDISDSLGFYNPFTNRVFIRHTAYPELNKYLLDHEFEHLLEEEATDSDENGIRHKKFFKDFFVPLFTGYKPSTHSFSPFGIFGHPSKKEVNAKKDQEQQISQPQTRFGNLGGTNPLANPSNNYGSPISPFSEQQSKNSALNQGLSGASINPLLDIYSKYGRPAGLLNF